MKKFAIWLCVIVMLAAAIVLAMPWFMSRDGIKERVAGQLSELTGKPVLLKGDSSVSLWPFLRVTYDDVVIGGELALADLPPLVRMDGLEASLSPVSALSGNVHLNQVTLIRPRFHLQINAQGTANWALRKGALAERLQSSADTQPEVLKLGSIKVVDGIADYTNLQTGTGAQLTAMSGIVSWPDTRNSGTADLTGVWRGEVVRLTANVTAPFDLLRGKASRLTANFNSKPVNFSYSGELMLGNTSAANGKMSAICPSPRRLLDWIGQPIPVATNVAETFVEGDVTAVGGRIEFQEATVRMGGHQGVGRLQLQRGDSGPVVNGTLAFDTLWLPNPATLALQGGDVSPSGKLDLSFLEGFGLDLRLSAEAATLGPFEVVNMAAAAIVSDGGASFEIGDAEALDGSMAGSISVSKGRGIGLFATDLSLTAVNLEQLSSLYGTGELAVNGTGNARFRLRSSGTSTQGLLLNLDGDGMIESKNGTIRGIDLIDLPLDVTGATEGPATPFSGSTPFDEMAIKFSIVNGSAFFDGSSMKSGALNVSVGGQLDLQKRSLALRGEITRQAGEKASSSPFFVGGNTAAPLFVMLPKSGPKPLKSQ